LTSKKLQISFGFCNLYAGYLPVVTNNIYGKGLLKVADGGRILPLRGGTVFYGGVKGGMMGKFGLG
jgi:hypothetical protein